MSTGDHDAAASEEDAGVSGHGPSGLADDIAGFLQDQRQHIGFQPVYVPYWDLINWQQEAEQLQRALAAQAPLVDAVARYGASLAAFRAAHAAGRGCAAERSTMLAIKAELDALALACPTPDAGEVAGMPEQEASR
jgi:hypothetical protein